MKKIYSFLLTLLVSALTIFSFTACASGSDDDAEKIVAYEDAQLTGGNSNYDVSYGTIIRTANFFSDNSYNIIYEKEVTSYNELPNLSGSVNKADERVDSEKFISESGFYQGNPKINGTVTLKVKYRYHTSAKSLLPVKLTNSFTINDGRCEYLENNCSSPWGGL